nr:hypothetical protein [Labrenzia sp. PHM005]
MHAACTNKTGTGAESPTLNANAPAIITIETNLKRVAIAPFACQSAMMGPKTLLFSKYA